MGLLGPGIAAGLLWFSALSLGAATFVVTSLSDSGPGSLRQAIADANAPGGTVLFSNITGTIVLFNPLDPITGNVAIIGPGNGLLSVSGDGRGWVLAVNPGATAVVSSLTITRGAATNGNGAGIANQGTLTLLDCAVSNNLTVGGFGGGIYSSGSLSILGCIIASNQVAGGAGANGIIGSGGGGGGAGLGGGLFIAGGSVIISNTLFTGNLATGGTGGSGGGGLSFGPVPSTPGGVPNGGYGGGIFVPQFPQCRPMCQPGGYIGEPGGFGGGGGGGGNAIGNSAPGGSGGYGAGSGAPPNAGAGGGGGGGLGGGLFLQDGSLQVLNSTLTNNSVLGGTAGFGGTNGMGIGAGLFHWKGTVAVSNSSIVDRDGIVPAIVVNPSNQIVFAGTNVAFTLTVTGSPPVSIQWRKEGSSIPGATNNVLVLTNVQKVDSGPYSAFLTNAYGTTTSPPVRLDVFVKPPAPEIQRTWPAGGIGELIIADIAADSQQNIYLGGLFQNRARIGTNVIVGTGGSYNLCLARFGPSGVLEWVRTGSTPAGVSGGQVEVDAQGDVYCAGNFYGTMNLEGVSLPNGTGDVFVAKFSPAGALRWARQLGVNGVSIQQLKVTASGQVYVASAGGITNSLSDVFIESRDSLGNRRWLFTGGDPYGVDYPYLGLAADSIGDCFLTGSYFSSNIVFGGSVLTNAGNSDLYLLRLKSSGGLEWIVRLGGPDYESNPDAAADGAGNIWVGGRFRASTRIGTNMLTTAGWDAFVAKYGSTGEVLKAWNLGGTEAGIYSLAVDTAGSLYVNGGYQGILRLGESELYSPSLSIPSAFILKYDSDGHLDWTLENMRPFTLDTFGHLFAIQYVGTNSYVVQVQTGAIPLGILRTNGVVIAFWEQPASGFVLERTTALASAPVSTAWSQVPFPYQTNTTHISVTVPAPAGSAFYRLRKP